LIHTIKEMIMEHHAPGSGKRARVVMAVVTTALVGAVTLTAQYSMTVNRDRLINSQNEPQNWLMMNGDYASTRYSKLSQINRQNVKDLRMVWALALGGMQDVGQNGPESELNPLIDNGFMYTSDGWGTLYKIDARNPGKGDFVWVTDPGVKHQGNIPRSRGIALWEDLVIANLPDGRVKSCGDGTSCRNQAIREAKRGRIRTTRGRPAAAASGRPDRTIRRRG
jgi:glucose dehydrogenase